MSKAPNAQKLNQQNQEALNERIKQFMIEYRALAEKHGFDFFPQLVVGPTVKPTASPKSQIITA